MPQLRAPDGSIVNVDDAHAGQLIAGGYSPVSIAEASQSQASLPTPSSGVLAAPGALASSFLSGATLGISDYALKGLLEPEDFERLKADREAHPFVSTGGQILGAIAGGPTPAGYLGRATGALAEGGGVAAKLGAGAIEGGVQNAGAYLADTALGDRELSAEGLVGALGSGMEFGAGAGGVALGIEQGTIAARRLFSRVTGSAKEAQAAEQAWAAKYQTTIEAHDAAADIARAKLAEAALTRQHAQLAQQRAAADLAEARIPRPAGAPELVPPGVPAEPGIPSAGEAVPSSPAATPGTTTPTPGAPTSRPEPPAFEMARMIRDRAAQISEPEVRAWDAANATRLMRLSLEVQTAGGIPRELAALTSRGAETAAQRSAALSEAAEKELTSALAEHDGARIKFMEALRKIDAYQPTLDKMLASAGPGDLETMLGQVGGRAPGEPGLEKSMRALLDHPDVVGAGGTPVGEFGPPGAGRFKTPDELARLAAGSEGNGIAPALEPAQSMRQLRGGARGTPVGQPELPSPGAAATAPPGAPLEIRRIRQGGKVTFEATLPDGSTRTLADRGEVTDLVNAQLPQGFQHGAMLETHRDLAIEHGLPKDAAGIRENALYVTRPSELADHGIIGGALDTGRAESVAEARRASAKLDPIEIKVDRDGKYWLEDGNHRLQEAAKSNAPVAIKFTPVKEFEWKGGSTDISDRIRGALPKGEGAIAAEAPAAAAAESNGGRIRVVRIGKPTAGTFEAHLPDGTVSPISRAGMGEWMKDHLPPGFESGNLGTHRNFSIEYGIPKTPGDIVDNAMYVVRPSEFAERGAVGNKIRPADLESVKSALSEGKRLPPVLVDMAPDGELHISDGNHRMLASAQLGDREIAVEFRRSPAPPGPGAPEDPNISVSGRLRDAIRGSSVRAPAAATDTLTGQLRGMQQKVGAGESLVEMGAPARAGYLAAKEARTAEAAAHFRGKALEAREARAGAVAAGETPNPFHEPLAAGGGSEMDQFFHNLNTPKTRDAYVAANIGRAMREEGSHAAALAKVEREWAERPGAVRTAEGHPMAAKQLEAAHDAALERADAAATPGERAVAAREVQAIERQLTAVGARPGAVEDVAAVAETVTKYEKASARLTEALGTDAPPAAQEAAKAVRAAEAEVERKSVARTTRAIEDHATNRPPATSAAEWNEQRMKQGAGDALAPPPRPTAAPGAAGNPQVASAKAARLRADADLARARAVETEAKIGAGTAKRTAAETRATAEAARPTAPEPGPPSKLGAIATAVGVAAEVGIPGLPHPKDIPLIGPLLSMYLKYRAVKAAAGRFVGRIPATGDARAAALVARTKDKIATAVDRTLGLAADLAPKARGPLVATAVVLGHRVFDDGQPDAPKGASEAQLAAVRIREISTAATQPDAVAAMVRQRLGGVTDPDLIDAAVKTLQAQFQYLANTMPKAPPPNPYTKTQWVPSAGDTANLARRLAVLQDPQAAIDNPTPAGADALANFYPKLAKFAQQRLADRAEDIKNPVEYYKLVRASVVFQIPMHASLQPENAAVLRGAFAGTSAGPSPTPGGPSGGPPPPSIAGPANINQLYQTSADRRAQR